MDRTLQLFGNLFLKAQPKAKAEARKRIPRKSRLRNRPLVQFDVLALNVHAVLFLVRGHDQSVMLGAVTGGKRRAQRIRLRTLHRVEYRPVVQKVFRRGLDRSPMPERVRGQRYRLAMCP